MLIAAPETGLWVSESVILPFIIAALQIMEKGRNIEMSNDLLNERFIRLSVGFNSGQIYSISNTLQLQMYDVIIN